MVFKREDLIQNIKDCGQSLIDNAEKIAADYKYRCGGMVISCYVDEEDRAPSISFTTELIPERWIDRIAQK